MRVLLILWVLFCFLSWAGVKDGFKHSKVRFGDVEPISSVDITPDSRYVISGDGEGVIALWDIKVEKLCTHLKGIRIL